MIVSGVHQKGLIHIQYSVYVYITKWSPQFSQHWSLYITSFRIFLKMRSFKLYSLQFSNMQLSIINYSHHAIHYIPKTFYFITGTFNFCSPPIPHLCQPTICFMYLWVQFWGFFGKEPTCKWNYTVLSFYQTYFPCVLSMLLQMSGFPFCMPK